MAELRKRNLINADEGVGSDETRDFTPLLMQNSNSNKAPSAYDLLQKNPTKFGYAMKKNNSCLVKVLPCWVPEYKRRFFILLGNFLYRFSSEHGEKIKGVPIPLDAVKLNTVDSITFSISMIRKEYIIRCDSASDCGSWVNEINKRKHQAIRENMGHAPIDPAVKDLNEMSSKMFFDRLDREREEAIKNLKTMNGNGNIGSPFPNMGLSAPDM